MSFVQDISNSTAVASGTTISQTITGVTAGSLLRVVVGYIEPSNQRSITVSDGNSYTAATILYYDSSNSQWGIQEFYLAAASAGSHTVTATFSGATNDQFIYIQERSGCSGLDVAGTVLNSVPGASGANVIASNAITTTQTDDVCGFTVLVNGTAPATTTGTTLTWVGRTAHPWTPQTSGLMASEDLSSQASGGYTATFGMSSAGGRYLTYVVSYVVPPPNYLSVPHTVNNGTRASPVSVSLGAAQAAGALVVVLQSNGDMGTVTLSDTVNSNPYQILNQYYSATGFGTVTFAMVVTNGVGTPTVTAHSSTSAGMQITLFNVAGFLQLPTYDPASVSQNFNASTTAVSGAPVSNHAAEVLIAGMNTGSFVSVAPSGWITTGNPPWYVLPASIGSVSLTATLGSASYYTFMGLGIYDGAGAPVGGPIPRLLYIMP